MLGSSGDFDDSSASSNVCVTCCSSCSIKRHEFLFAQASTFTPFENLLHAGSLTFRLLSDGSLCTHQHAEDGFHTLQDVFSLYQYLALEDIELLDSVSFLLKNAFVLVTYMLAPSTMGVILRVYLIPHDVPGARGTLRTRSEDNAASMHLRRVLSRVSKNRASWYADDELYGHPSLEESFLLPNQDHRSLSRIFNDLTTMKHGKVLPSIPKLRATLYEYQEESVARMLAMESPNRITDDPLYIPVAGMNDRVFYLQPTTMDLALHRPRSYQSRGGILCEELGTGKTVMTLALTLATLDVLPDPPEHDDAEILTPLALRYFPRNSYEAYLDPTIREIGNPGANGRNRIVPSLVEILCHYARKHPSFVDLRAIEDTPLWDVIRKNTPFYFHFDHNHSWDASPRRRKPDPQRLTYLTTATLIVVPATLQTQWYSEILKHCSSSIRTLFLKSGKDIPPPLTLASDYDIVLTTYDLISTEAMSSKNLSFLNSGFTCRCPEFASIRVPDCSCQPSENISPLLQIRWKRLVRDEGHNASSRSTGVNHFLRIIDTERRWIVTGTPTTNLLGLNFGSITEEDVESEEIEYPDTSSSLSSALHLVSKLYDLEPDMQVLKEDNTEKMVANLVEGLQCSPVWNKVDREDLRKLGSMLSDFLGVLPFAAEPDSFSRLVVNGLMDKDGPLPGTTRVLEQVMSENMVRHRVADIEKHVRLPPLKEELVLLDLEQYGQMTYNVLLSFVVVNAVDSERRDMDYLFHPSKAAALASTIENLSHSLFWRFDENALDYELTDNILRAENAIIHARERGQPDEDVQLVEQAIKHLRKALEDQQFRDMQHGLEVPYRILHSTGNLKQSWGLVGEPNYASDTSASFFAYPSYALDLRDAILRQPLISESALTEHAALVRARNRALVAYADARKSKSEKRSDARGSSEKRRLRGEAGIDRVRLDTARRTVTVDSTEKLKELHEEYRKAEERLKAEAADDDYEHSSPHSSLNSSPASRRLGTIQLSSARRQLLRQSPYAQIRVGNSTSSKLNYILEEIRRYSNAEKFLIFSGQPFNLVHISEGLDLMGIKHLLFMKETTSVKGKRPRRDQWLTTFETSGTYRVLLMELKYGARGLNIVSASRVIFCEPVWHADVESQAIKRVYRIGQTRPVTVKTLAIRSTFEEYMVQRRHAYKGTVNSKLPGLTEEWGVRNYLQNPIFLETPSNNITELNFPLIQVPVDPDELMEGDEVAVDAHGDSSMGYTTVAFGSRMEDDEQHDPDRLDLPSPKRRKVHFA